MPVPIATGNNAPNFHPTELTADPRRGMGFRQHVTCGKLTVTAQAQLLNYLWQVQQRGGSGKLVFAGEKPSLEYELSGVPDNLSGVVSEVFIDDWQLQIDDLTNTIFANTVLGANLLYNDRTVLMRYMKLGSATSLDEVVASLNSDAKAGTVAAPNGGNGGTGAGLFQVPKANGAFTALANQVFKMIDKDQTEFLDPLPVLHHVTGCSPNANYNSTRANEMCIYTTAQLLSECGSGWNRNLPGRLYSQIASFPTRTAALDEAPYYTWGWLKMRARQGTQTNWAIEAQQEWKLNLWPNIWYKAL